MYKRKTDNMIVYFNSDIISSEETTQNSEPKQSGWGDLLSNHNNDKNYARLINHLSVTIILLFGYKQAAISPCPNFVYYFFYSTPPQTTPK